MNKKFEEQITKKTTSQHLERLMKEGKPTVADQITRDIDLKKLPK